MFHYIYRTTRSDGAFYIGVHTTHDMEDGYLGSGTRLLASIRKHGRDAHTKHIMEMIDTREAADAREQELVTRELLKDPLCLNLTTGGKHGSHEHHMSTREKMSAAAKGIPKSAEHRHKIAEALRGRKRSAEHCANLSRAAKARVADPSWINPWAGEKGSRMVAENNRRRRKTV